MQALLLTAARSNVQPPTVSPSPAPVIQLHRPARISSVNHFLSPLNSLSHLSSFCSSSLPLLSSKNAIRGVRIHPSMASSPAATGFASSVYESDQAKLALVAKRLQNTARYFKRLGSFAFWGQLLCTIVAAVILSFSIVVTGKITSPVTFYATAGGIAAAFISIFWSFGYLRLSERLQRTANDPSKAPARADVVKSLRNGVVVNLLGMGSAILGLLATVGLLVAKALTTSSTPYYQGVSPGYSPVLALDVFLMQASANTILSHFIGLVSSLELLRSVSLPPPTAPVAKLA
ncbi:hypothetical protein Cgig2_002863 [Carnegiea gigantea]|uniref:Protein TIC 21, chloroplastic n=1 Tax=Carnegiea gigantea TaxID=171969 RepID=A0A9Q1QM86_9CARY|nr:hypothetical protein Cgig2_002863 [Carnegiea gigantea]